MSSGVNVKAGTSGLNRINGYGGSFAEHLSPFLSFMSLAETLKVKRKQKIANMTPEERVEYDKEEAEKEARWEARKEKWRVNDCVNKGICPNGCIGHLERGKKEKDNNYKRPFICSVCGSKWYRED